MKLPYIKNWMGGDIHRTPPLHIKALNRISKKWKDHNYKGTNLLRKTKTPGLSVRSKKMAIQFPRNTL